MTVRLKVFELRRRPRAMKTSNQRVLRHAIEEERALDAEDYAALAERPRLRSECIDGPRPCPWAGCKYHAAYDVSPSGSLVENYPGRSLDDLDYTCTLDVADAGAVTLDEVGDILNISRERVRQIQDVAYQKALKSAVRHGIDLEDMPLPKVHHMVALEERSETLDSGEVVQIRDACNKFLQKRGLFGQHAWHKQFQNRPSLPPPPPLSDDEDDPDAA